MPPIAIIIVLLILGFYWCYAMFIKLPADAQADFQAAANRSAAQDAAETAAKLAKAAPPNTTENMCGGADTNCVCSGNES